VDDWPPSEAHQPGSPTPSGTHTAVGSDLGGPEQQTQVPGVVVPLATAPG